MVESLRRGETDSIRTDSESTIEFTRLPRGTLGDFVVSFSNENRTELLANVKKRGRVRKENTITLTMQPVDHRRLDVDMDRIAHALAPILTPRRLLPQLSGEKIKKGILKGDDADSQLGIVDGFSVAVRLDGVEDRQKWQTEGSRLRCLIIELDEKHATPEIKFILKDAHGDRPVIERKKRDALDSLTERIAAAFGGPRM